MCVVLFALCSTTGRRQQHAAATSSNSRAAKVMITENIDAAVVDCDSDHMCLQIHPDRVVQLSHIRRSSASTTPRHWRDTTPPCAQQGCDTATTGTRRRWLCGRSDEQCGGKRWTEETESCDRTDHQSVIATVGVRVWNSRRATSAQ